MSTESSREVAKALDEGKLEGISPEGTCKAQESGDSIYSLIPPDLARANGLSQGSPLALGYHPESNILLVALDGDLFPDEEAEP